MPQNDAAAMAESVITADIGASNDKAVTEAGATVDRRQRRTEAPGPQPATMVSNGHQAREIPCSVVCHPIAIRLSYRPQAVIARNPKVVEARMRHFRTLFISDVHLGARGCQAELLLDFLRYHDADTIYLVGDIVDGWQLKSGWYWPQTHNDVVQKLFRKARKGACTIYVPGNHDEWRAAGPN